MKRVFPLTPLLLSRGFRENLKGIVSDTTHRRTIPFGDTTFRGYSGTLRTLNGERLPFNSLRDLTVVERSAVLNGILQTPTLHASTLTVPKPHLQLLQTATLSHLAAKKKYAGTSVSGRSEYASENGQRPSRLRSKLKRGGGYRHQGRSLYTRE